MTETTKSPAELEIESFELLKFEVPSIDGQEQYDTAVSIRTELATFLKEAEASFKAIKDPVWQEHKKICQNETDICSPVRELMKKINGALVRFDQEQERQRRERQRLLDEERARLEERERINRAASAEAQGMDAETVDAVLDTPVSVPVVHAAPTYEKSKAVGFRDNFSGECFDLFALVKFVAKNRSYLNLLAPDQTAINKLAKALKEQLQIPGVRVENRKIAVTGRG